MHSPQSVVPFSLRRIHRRGRKEDLAYQAVTVAAMVGLLASVWVF